MKKLCKRMISVLLVFSLILTTSVSTLALDGEEYICELRLVYAEDSDDARDILDDGEFYEYELYDENLNEGTGEIGVYLAYKTTEDIEDAITDITVMQMKGGYTEGNYQEMIQQSYDEYIAMGKIYLDAVDYMIEAYDAGDRFAEVAYRQLNFYSVTDEELSYDGELLGDIFADGISAPELATFFLEGNSYALKNIRALISMGVAYNEDGDSYLDKVEKEAAKLKADPSVYRNNDDYYYDLAYLIEATILQFVRMFEELETFGKDLNYEDETITALELKYAEYMALAEALRGVDYLNDMSLYDFIMDFPPIASYDDIKTLYPLAAALNEGQASMTKVAHYYDVVRYSIAVGTDEFIDDKLKELEEKYSENPFDIFTGVDRSIFDGTFALTSAAYRTDACSESGIADFILGSALGGSGAVAGVLGVTLVVGGLLASSNAGATMAGLTEKLQAISDAQSQHMMDAINNMASEQFRALTPEAYLTTSYDSAITNILQNYSNIDPAQLASMSFFDKYTLVEGYIHGTGGGAGVHFSGSLTQYDLLSFNKVHFGLQDVQNTVVQTGQDAATRATETATQTAAAQSYFAGAMYIIGGAMMVYSAITLGISIYNYYHPDYDDIPTSMVDLVDTIDGDRYVKYDVVYEAEAQDGDEYAAADLNAFAGERWNALYYTKSYEAGKPLLANFDLSSNNNTPDDGYAPVRRFGDVVCYDLNRYNFGYGNDVIYLSVEQSEYNKSAVMDVPELVGSIFSAGWALLAGGVGLLAGIGGTIGTQKLFKKKKQSASNTSEA